MKLPREVKIRIRTDGTVQVETHGFIGESCVDLSKVFEKALAGDGADGDERVTRDIQPEYYHQDQEQGVDVRDRAE